ncbi:uncharacterized protein LOC116413156 [Galleria mellonella]|uniref:Uncharacterized protein LOC116413156 n=1 Tax=Galleria mellonella TaxID=7137 RepID=A0A6J3C264_GALME|nr:uncharacterized protein LOC116413156 [Galleria mellonella]
MTKSKDNKTVRGYSERSTGRSNHVLDVMCRIVNEDGPEPMRNMKPTQKVPNAAEQFSSEHHGEHEACGRQSRDRLSRVSRHNETYPKMHDELNKRRSCAKVTVNGAKRSQMTQLISMSQSKVCAKKVSHFPNRKAKSSSQPYDRSRKRKTRGRNRISKPKTRRSNRKKSRNRVHYRLSMANKGCQYTNCQLHKHKKSGNNYSNVELSDGIAPDEKSCSISATDNVKNPVHLISSSRLSEGGNTSNASEPISANPDTSEPSISTYNSFTTIDQEPMESQ